LLNNISKKTFFFPPEKLNSHSNPYKYRRKLLINSVNKEIIYHTSNSSVNKQED